jgi:hypothetical protein
LYPVAVGGAGDASTTGEHRRPTAVLDIQWAPEDALPFSLCLSAVGAALDCAYLTNITVARGNVILVDHGRTTEDPNLGLVPIAPIEACCVCEGEPADVTITAGRYRPTLSRAPLTFRDPAALATLPAARTLVQDVRAAVPVVTLTEGSGATWNAAPDLLGSGPDDRQFVVEIDNDGIAHLRFGDGELGRIVPTGAGFQARYRVGCGVRGNVGAEAISRLVLRDTKLSGITVSVRNPLPAQGGTDPEPISEAKLVAPRAFRKRLERAITADDYATLAERDPALQRAAARLAWNGSWYEAEVGVDALGGDTAGASLVEGIAARLHRYRRIGHDLRVKSANLVPIKVTLEICVRPGYDRGHVQAALLARFCSPPGRTGTKAFFDPDNLSFGDSVPLSRIVSAAQAVTGVECATVTELRRLFEPANRELETGLLMLGAQEIAQLENNPNHPERGQLALVMRGGR